MSNNSKRHYSKDFHFIRQLKNIFTSKKVLISVSITLFFMVFFNFMSKIQMPFLNLGEYEVSDSSLYNMLNLLGGGGLTNMSMFAIGISPYITTQIIIQLLSSEIIPPLSKLAKSGERGRKKIEVISRVVTLPFAILQAYSIYALFSSQGVTIENSPFSAQGTTFFYIALMVAGTYISIFFSDLITKKGVGNGTTIIILAGVLSSLIPNFIHVKTNIDLYVNGSLYQVISFIVYILFYLAILWIITFVNNSTRKIPIQQTGQSLMKLGDELPYLPFKLNTGGVIPVIFASSIMTLPLTVSEIIRSQSGENGFTNFCTAVFSFSSIGGIIVYIVLIILFTFFYSYVQLNPNRISVDFMKSGRFIIGVKIGKDTEKYISQVLYRINWIGGPFLALIASLPYIVSLATTVNGVPIIPSNSALGGTGIIILVTGTLDLWQSIVSASTTTSYKLLRTRIENSGEQVVKNDNVVLW